MFSPIASPLLSVYFIGNHVFEPDAVLLRCMYSPKPCLCGPLEGATIHYLINIQKTDNPDSDVVDFNCFLFVISKSTRLSGIKKKKEATPRCKFTHRNSIYVRYIYTFTSSVHAYIYLEFIVGLVKYSSEFSFFQKKKN